MFRAAIHKIFYDFKRGKINNWTEKQIVSYNTKLVKEMNKRGMDVAKYGELDDISSF